MKKTRMNVFLCLLAILFLATGCSQLFAPESRTSSVRHDNTMLEYGNHIYVSLTVNPPYKYNRETGTMAELCMDAECKNNCILCQCIDFRTLGIQDNKLYFSCEPRGRHNPNLPEWSRGMGFVIGYQDQISGKVVPLRTLSQEEAASIYTFLDQGFIYYSRRILKEGGDPQNRDDYKYTITRLSLDGKIEENLEALTVGGVLCVADGYIYTLGKDGSTIGVSKITDEGVEAPVTLFDIRKNGYQTYYSTIPYYYNGTLFFLVSDGTVTTFSDSENSSHTRVNTYLIALNTKTGEGKQLVEEPICQFTVTENKIYYIPVEFRHLYPSENDDESYAQDPVATISTSSKIYSCNLDGSKPKLVLDLPRYKIAPLFLVIDNTLYGWLADLENNQWLAGKVALQSNFASVDLSSGNVTFAQKQDNATP